MHEDKFLEFRLDQKPDHEALASETSPKRRRLRDCGWFTRVALAGQELKQQKSGLTASEKNAETTSAKVVRPLMSSMFNPSVSLLPMLWTYLCTHLYPDSCRYSLHPGTPKHFRGQGVASADPDGAQKAWRWSLALMAFFLCWRNRSVLSRHPVSFHVNLGVMLVPVPHLVVYAYLLVVCGSRIRQICGGILAPLECWMLCTGVGSLLAFVLPGTVLVGGPVQKAAVR